MNQINKNETGLALGGFFGLFHAFWAILVLIGWAQPLISWIFDLHFIVPPYTISAFQLGTAVLLVIVTSIIGYILGWVFAWLWNRLHRSAV